MATLVVTGRIIITECPTLKDGVTITQGLQVLQTIALGLEGWEEDEDK